MIFVYKHHIKKLSDSEKVSLHIHHKSIDG
jgi:hypothetical protein